MALTGRQVAFCIAGLIVVGYWKGSAFAQIIDRETVARTLDEQQLSQSQARDLLANVLDQQLRRLEENGLTEHESYRDIELMRHNLQNLINGDMQHVVDTLRNAENLPTAKRDEAFREARLQIRQVVRQLTVERQLLLQRLKIFELADQVRKLIQIQITVQTSTVQLIGRETSNDQAARTLKVIEDQRDFQDLYRQMVKALHDLKLRRGPLATIGVDGLRLLDVLELARHVDDAGRQLQAIRLEPANEAQMQIVKGLKELVKLIGRAQGTIDTENTTAHEAIRALIDRQKQLRDQTKLLAERQAPPAELIEQQAQLQGSIARLQEQIATFPKADTHRQQAEAAVFDAASHLLENKSTQAVADQGRVLGSLAALERAISEDSPSLSRNLSADELSRTVQDLEAIQTRLSGAIGASEMPGSTISPSHLEEVTRDICELVTAPDPQNPRPDFVRVALKDVIDTLASIPLSSDRSPQNENADSSAENLNSVALRSAFKRAKTTVDRALVDTRRLGMAIQIGELARVTEVLERMAAEQLSIVKETVGLATDVRAAAATGIERARELLQRQCEVTVVADRIAAALRQIAPDSATSIADEAARARRLQDGDLLAKAFTSPDEIRRSMETAISLSRRFSDLAQELRQQVVSTAEDLAQLSTDQSEQLSKLRTAVESAVDELPSEDMPIQLERVGQSLDRAIQEQVRAQGNSRAAEAMGLKSSIQQALKTQEIVDAALDVDPVIGRSELKSTTREAEVAEMARTAALTAKALHETSPPDEHERMSQIRASLIEAEQAATHAAKQVLAGNTTSAMASRKTIHTKLTSAIALAEQIVTQAMNDEITVAPDRQAQKDAAQSAVAAQQELAALGGDTGNVLAAAIKATSDAATSRSDELPNSADVQKKALTELTSARHAWNQSIQQRAITESQQFSHKTEQLGELATRIESVEPSAAYPIRATTTTTGQEANPNRSARHIAAQIARMRIGLEQAIAELGAREQEVRHDLAIAESVATSIKRQQAATTTIAEQASELQKLATASQAESSSAVKRTAAQKLNEARRRFVDAQRSTGQAAVELSGQIEVANAPLREALELAAKFVGPDQNTQSAENTEEATADTQPADQSPQPNDSHSQQSDANGSSSSKERDVESDSRGAPAGKNPNDLGKGFVSQSPDLTAEMMAGADAIHAAKQALAAQLPPSQQSDADSKAQRDSSSETEQSDTQSDAPGRSSKLAKGSNAGGTNQKVKDGMIDQQPEGTEAKGQASGESRQTDENVSSKSLKDETWFAKLPPELRKSLRAGIGQKSPRTYEERLKKYFQSVD